MLGRRVRDIGPDGRVGVRVRLVEVHADGVHSSLAARNCLMEREQSRSKRRNTLATEDLRSLHAGGSHSDLDADAVAGEGGSVCAKGFEKLMKSHLGMPAAM
jgi:chloramphenicol 3-O-phosphotransferase